MVASNSSTILDDGDGQTVATISNPLTSPILAHPAGNRKPEIITAKVNTSLAQRETGDHVNRFLLCALVSESAKLIKSSAADAGASLPMPMIVRGVLRSYRLAAKDEYGALAKPELDIAGLRRLNRRILKDEIARHSQAGVKNSEARLANAKQVGDDMRISAEKDGLERAVELRDRLAKKFNRSA